jgi:hypothetical protein
MRETGVGTGRNGNGTGRGLRSFLSGGEKPGSSARQKLGKTKPTRKSIVEVKVTKEGSLDKQTQGKFKRWQTRYFTLAGHYLQYTDNEKGIRSVKALIDIHELRSVDRSGILITLHGDSSDKEAYHFRARATKEKTAEQEAISWHEVLKQAINSEHDLIDAGHATIVSRISERAANPIPVASDTRPKASSKALQPALSKRLNLSRGGIAGSKAKQIPLYGEYLPTPEDSAALLAVLSERGIDGSKYGKNGSKTVDKLLEELRDGACVLATTKDKGLRRIMHRVHVKARREVATSSVDVEYAVVVKIMTQHLTNGPEQGLMQLKNELPNSAYPHEKIKKLGFDKLNVGEQPVQQLVELDKQIRSCAERLDSLDEDDQKQVEDLLRLTDQYCSRRKEMLTPVNDVLRRCFDSERGFFKQLHVHFVEPKIQKMYETAESKSYPGLATDYYHYVLCADVSGLPVHPVKLDGGHGKLEQIGGAQGRMMTTSAMSGGGGGGSGQRSIGHGAGGTSEAA